MRASAISIAAMSGARSPPIWSSIGSPVTRADLERIRGGRAPSRSRVALQAGTLYNTPPPTQGLASLIILALFERLRVAEAESFDHVHGLVEATKRAFRVRDRFVTDPERLDAIRPRAISRNHSSTPRPQKIDRRKAARWPAPAGEGDTIWMGAADSSGLVVSYIQSLYWEFGSGCVLPRTGVLMQNRGASFSLEQGRREPAAARPPAVPHAQSGARGAARRPRHGLRHDGRRRPAADRRPRCSRAMCCIACRWTRRSTAPRWLLGRTWGSTHTNLRLESRFDEG